MTVTAPLPRPVEVVNGPEPVLVMTDAPPGQCEGKATCVDPIRWAVDSIDDSEPQRRVCNRHLVWAVGRVVKIGRRQG